MCSQPLLYTHLNGSISSRLRSLCGGRVANRPLSCAELQPPGVSAVSKPSLGTAYLYSVLIFVFPLIGAIALVHSNRVAIQVQIRLRAQLTSAVYLKALRLSSRCRVMLPCCQKCITFRTRYILAVGHADAVCKPCCYS